MVEVCYAVIQAAEVLLNAVILHGVFREHRKEGRWVVYVEVIGSILFGMVHVLESGDSFVSNIAILFFSVEFSCLFRMCYKVKYIKIFLLESFYKISISFLKLSILIAECIIYDKRLIEINRGERTIPECVGSVVLMLAVIFAVKRISAHENYKKFIQMLLNKNTGLMLAAAGIEWFLLSYNMRLGIRGFRTGDFLFNMMLIFSIFICLNYLILREAYGEVWLDKDRLNISQELLQKQNREIHEMYKKNRESIHEQCRTLEYLYYCIREERYGEAEAFLSKNLDGLKEGRAEVWTGLPFLDFIINYKKQAMDKRDITFLLELDVYEYPFEETELGVLLGNLLDNAIEACEKCAPGEKKIYLRVWNVKYMFMLRLRNSSSRLPVMTGRRFVTDKADKNLHGMGVEQVRHIVEKYGGDISFQYGEGYFETKIMVDAAREERYILG